MLTSYLVITAMLAIPAFVTFVVLGIKAQKFKETRVRSSQWSAANDWAATRHDHHYNKKQYCVPTVGKRTHSYCGIRCDYVARYGDKNYGSVRDNLCKDCAAEYDKMVRPSNDMMQARRYARGSMRAWAVFLATPLWFLGVPIAVAALFAVTGKTGKVFWSDVRTIAEHVTDKEIEDDDKFHAGLIGPSKQTPLPIEPVHQPVYYDTKREQEVYAPRIKAPKGRAPVTAKSDDYWDFMNAPRMGKHESRDPLCDLMGSRTHGMYLRACDVCENRRNLREEKGSWKKSSYKNPYSVDWTDNLSMTVEYDDSKMVFKTYR